MSTNFGDFGLKGLTVRGMPLLSAYPGKAFWVDSNGAGGSKGTFDRPCPTVVSALLLCVAGRGDIIMVKAGHAEASIAVAGIDVNVIGVAVVCLGAGGKRPTFSFTTVVGASLKVSAASVTIINALFSGGIDALTGPLNIAAADCSLISCEWRDTTGQATDVIVTTAAADRLLIDGYWHNGDSAAGANAAIALVGGSKAEIRNFKITGNFAVSAIDIRTTLHSQIDIHDGYIWNQNSGDLCVKDTITGSTGKIGPNLNFMLTDNAANITEAITGATFHQFQPINVCNLAGEIGMPINTTASTDA